MHYLVVEDDPEMAQLLQRGLETSEIKVILVENPDKALAEVRSRDFEVIILDVNLPLFNGFELARRIRASGNITPILFLTAQDSLSDKVAGFEVGGDDYLPKPFEFIELNARLKALRRRSRNRNLEAINYGDLKVDLPTQRINLADKVINLSPREFALLALLLRNLDVIYTRAQILDEIWDGAQYVDPNIVDQYVSYIRKKLDKNSTTSIIETIRGVGYRIPRLAP